jgi:hypothetical protein
VADRSSRKKGAPSAIPAIVIVPSKRDRIRRREMSPEDAAKAEACYPSTRKRVALAAGKIAGLRGNFHSAVRVPLTAFSLYPCPQWRSGFHCDLPYRPLCASSGERLIAGSAAIFKVGRPVRTYD